MNKATKIVATIGPATETVETIENSLKQEWMSPVSIPNTVLPNGTQSGSDVFERLPQRWMFLLLSFWISRTRNSDHHSGWGKHSISLKMKQSRLCPMAPQKIPRQPQIPQIVIDSARSWTSCADRRRPGWIWSSGINWSQVGCQSPRLISLFLTENSQHAWCRDWSPILNSARPGTARCCFRWIRGLRWLVFSSGNKTDIEILKGSWKNEICMPASWQNWKSVRTSTTWKKLSKYPTLWWSLGEIWQLEVPFKELTYWQNTLSIAVDNSPNRSSLLRRC